MNEGGKTEKSAEVGTDMPCESGKKTREEIDNSEADGSD